MGNARWKKIGKKVLIELERKTAEREAQELGGGGGGGDGGKESGEDVSLR